MCGWGVGGSPCLPLRFSFPSPPRFLPHPCPSIGGALPTKVRARFGKIVCICIQCVRSCVCEFRAKTEMTSRVLTRPRDCGSPSRQNTRNNNNNTHTHTHTHSYARTHTHTHTDARTHAHGGGRRGGWRAGPGVPSESTENARAHPPTRARTRTHK